MPLTIEELSELLLSVKVHKRQRPLSPIEVAKRIRILVEEEGSKAAVARRLGFKGTDMVHKFLRLLEMPPTVQGLVGWEGPSEGKLGLEMTLRILSLEAPADRDILAKTAVAEGLRKDDVSDVVSLKKKNPEKSIAECIKLMKGIQPVKEIGYAVVGEVSKDTKILLRRMSRKRDISVGDLLTEVICNAIGASGLKSSRIKGRYAILVFTEGGYQAFKRKSTDLDVSPDLVIDTMVGEIIPT